MGDDIVKDILLYFLTYDTLARTRGAQSYQLNEYTMSGQSFQSQILDQPKDQDTL